MSKSLQLDQTKVKHLMAVKKPYTLKILDIFMASLKIDSLGLDNELSSSSSSTLDSATCMSASSVTKQARNSSSQLSFSKSVQSGKEVSPSIYSLTEQHSRSAQLIRLLRQ